MTNTNTNTGSKDAKGRTVWRGPRGGLFVRTAGGRKAPPAAGGAGGGSRRVHPRAVDRAPVKGYPLNSLPADVLRKITAGLSTAEAARFAMLSRGAREGVRNTLRRRKEAVGAMQREFEKELGKLIRVTAAQVRSTPVDRVVPGTSLTVTFANDVMTEAEGAFKAGSRWFPVVVVEFRGAWSAAVKTANNGVVLGISSDPVRGLEAMVYGESLAENQQIAVRAAVRSVGLLTRAPGFFPLLGFFPR